MGLKLKIYILPVHKILQPGSTWMVYPFNHNDDYGLEQDFLFYLQSNVELLTNDPKEADFHYLPVFWTRWIYNHDWGLGEGGTLQQHVDRAILDDSKTVTIVQCAHNIRTKLGKTTIFWGSRSIKEGLDVPLICKEHKLPAQIPEKKYLVSFVGRLETHYIRGEMVRSFNNIPETRIMNCSMGTAYFVEKILESYITLCPRGYGGNSFRFFETMQLGGVPFLIGDIDIRPFKRYIDWANCSFYAKTGCQAVDIVKKCRKEDLLIMGDTCAKIWREKLTFGKWCKYVLKELEDLKS